MRSKRLTEYWKYSEYILTKYMVSFTFATIIYSYLMHVSILVFHEQRDSVLEQHETSVGVFAERTISVRHKYYHVQHERRSDQSLQPSDPRIVGGGRWSRGKHDRAQVSDTEIRATFYGLQSTGRSRISQILVGGFARRCQQSHHKATTHTRRYTR